MSATPDSSGRFTSGHIRTRPCWPMARSFWKTSTASRKDLGPVCPSPPSCWVAWWRATPFAAGRDRSRIAAEIDAYNAVNRAEAAAARWLVVVACVALLAGGVLLGTLLAAAH